jgi:hypothetical protein
MALVKRAAAKAAGRPERRLVDRDEAALVAQLGDADPEARRWAARDLAEHPSARAALLARLEREPAHPVREAILSTLLKFGGPEVVRGLLPFLRGEDAALRGGVLEVLQQLPAEVAVFMSGLLADPDSDVRIFAVDLACRLPHPDVPGWLLRVLREEPHVNVVAAALEGVAALGLDDAADALARVKERFGGDPYVEFLVDAAARERVRLP